MGDGYKKLIGLMKKGKYALAVLALGLLLLLWPKSGSAQNDVVSADRSAVAFDLEAFEEKLADTLSRIDGAGRAEVMLTLDTDTREILAQDERSQSQAQDQSSRTETEVTTVTVNDRTTGERPVVLCQIYPRYRGALVVLEGADQAGVKLAVTKAVSDLTGLGSDRITVVKMKDG